MMGNHIVSLLHKPLLYLFVKKHTVYQECLKSLNLKQVNVYTQDNVSEFLKGNNYLKCPINANSGNFRNFLMLSSYLCTLDLSVLLI